MIQLKTNDIYQIKRLVNNPINTNKFIYLDSMDGSLNIKNNKWFFDLNYYVIDNSVLPLNIFSTSLELPFASIKDITMQYSSSSNIPDWVTQKEYCKIYKTVFSIDTSESKFLEQNLNKYLMYLEFSFDINADVINNSGMDVSQLDLDGFISEWNLVHETMSFDFSNFSNLTDDFGSFENGSQFYLNSKTGYFNNEDTIFYKVNDTFNNRTSPIRNLIKLDTITPFLITKIAIKFFYALDDDSTIKLYESTNENNVYVYDTYELNFEQNTTYDEEKNEIVKSIDGTNGFYIPKRATGNIEILLSISQNDNTRICRFNINFSFVGDQQVKKIQIKEIFINDLTNFERMEF